MYQRAATDPQYVITFLTDTEAQAVRTLLGSSTVCAACTFFDIANPSCAAYKRTNITCSGLSGSKAGSAEQNMYWYFTDAD